MIPAYDEAFTKIEPLFASLGLSLTSKTDCTMVFANGERSVKFEVERYTHGLQASIIDVHGTRRELGLVMATIDPSLRARMVAEVKDLKAKYSFNNRSIAEMIDDGSLAHYLDVTVTFIRDFFVRHAAAAFDMPTDLQAEYDRKAAAVVAAFGAKTKASQ